MDFNALLAELKGVSDNLAKESGDRTLLSTAYCNKTCKAIDRVASADLEYDQVITGLWLLTAHFTEQLKYLKQVQALTNLSLKLFRECAKAVLNIQWQNLEEENAVRQSFLVSLSNLHVQLVPFKITRFQLLKTLTENPWTDPTLAKVMGGDIEEEEKEEVHNYIRQEEPIILQLRVDMMLKENCEEYALNLCNSCLIHPELKSDLDLRKTQLSLLFKLGQVEKLQEECQKLSVQDAVRVIKQLQTSKGLKELCTVLIQTFMVQKWIQPANMEQNKELLRLWIRHQAAVDVDKDQFKESVWAMAKLSQSTEQIVFFIDVLRQESGETYLQLYVDMCIFAINVDKGQMETNIKEGNMEAALARRGDMASICAKLSCLCHHTSLKVARICALTSFALKPTEQSFGAIGTFYNQGQDCCSNCKDKKREEGVLNPATLYEVERLLNMLRPEYLNPDNSYANVQILCRRFLHDGLRTAHQHQRKLAQVSQSSSAGVTQVEGPGKKKDLAQIPRPVNVFEALSPQDVHNTEMLLNRMRLQGTQGKPSQPTATQRFGQPLPAGSHKPSILHTGSRECIIQPAGPQKAQVKAKYSFDVDNAKNKQPYGVPLEQQHQYYIMKYNKELEQRRKCAQKRKDLKVQQPATFNPPQQTQIQAQQNLMLSQQQKQVSPQQHSQQLQQQKQLRNNQDSQLVQSALHHDSDALKKLTQHTNPSVVQAVLSIMKSSSIKTASAQGTNNEPSSSQQQQLLQHHQQVDQGHQQRHQPLPTVSTLLKPPDVQQELMARKPFPQSRPIMAGSSTPNSSSSPHNRVIRPTVAVGAASAMSSGAQMTNMASTIVTDSQKGEKMKLAKSHVEEIRRFMQTRMSNLPQKFISEPRQMSGSMVTVLNPTSCHSVSQPNLQNRPKTTVELAHEASLANLQHKMLQKQGDTIRLPASSQHKPNSNAFSQMTGQQHPSKTLQQQFLAAVNKPQAGQQQEYQARLNRQLTHQPGNRHNITLSLDPGNALPGQNTILPTDELSGSIQGIDDTVMKELLQDSGILAETFPDIDVEVGEDRPKKSSECLNQSVQGIFTTLSHRSDQNAPIRLYRFAEDPSKKVSKPVQSMPNQLRVMTHPYSTSLKHLGSNRALTSTVKGNETSGTTVYSQVLPRPSTSVLTLAASRPKLISTTAGRLKTENFSCNKQQISVLSRPNILQDQDEHGGHLMRKKPEEFQSVDQLRAMMKQEDIQGEVYMDSANNATYRCIICSHAFETLDNLREHVRNVCKPGLQSSSVYNNKIKLDRANSAKAGLETTTVFQCLRCFELCVSDAGIKEHRLTCKRVPTVPSEMKKESANVKSPKPQLPVPMNMMEEHQNKSNEAPEAPHPHPHPIPSSSPVTQNLTTSNVIKKETSQSDNGIDKASVSESSRKSALEISGQVSSKDLKASKKPTTIEEPKELPPPLYSEISGSGGSKFFKCTVCCQTCCSIESFLGHWKECVIKNPLKCQKPHKSGIQPVGSKLLTDVTLNNVLTVIACVASGEISGNDFNLDAELSDADYDLLSLQDPCKDVNKFNSSSEEMHSIYEQLDKSKFQDKSRERIGGQVPSKQGADITGENEEWCEDESFSSDKEDESSQSQTDSEQESVSSSRNVARQLRDRNTLKPIQSFINETFPSPYAFKGGVKAERGITRVVEEGKEKSELSTSSEEDLEEGELIGCKVCNITFQTRRILIQHYAGKHLKPYTMKRVGDSTSYFCHLCQKSFPTFRHYMHHVPNHAASIKHKMKIIMRESSSQRSLRIASQRDINGEKKEHESPKAMESRKQASKSPIDSLKRHMLTGKNLKTKIKLARKRKVFPVHPTTSEDDYSSDASNIKETNRLKKSSFRDRYRSKTGGNSLSAQYEDESSVQSSLDLSSEASFSRNQTESNDEDYVASEDYDSDENVKVPPETRSRGRSGQNLSGSCKRRRSTSGAEIWNGQRDNQDHYYLTSGVENFDNDSSSTVLVLSQQSDGNFLPLPDKENVAVEEHATVEGKRFESKPGHRVFVRFLNRQLKEQLRRSNLNPSVVIKMLSAKDIEKWMNDSKRWGDVLFKEPNTEIAAVPRVPKPSNEEVTSMSFSSSVSKVPSFLDSFLSFISNKDSACTENSNGSKRKVRSNSGPLAQSFNQAHAKEKVKTKTLLNSAQSGDSPFSRSRSSSAEGGVVSADLGGSGDTGGTTINCCTSSEGEGKNLPSGDAPLQESLSRFPTRRCSVNLGQKLDVHKLNIDKEIDTATPNRIKNTPDIETLKMVARENPPIVCLERHSVDKMFTTGSGMVENDCGVTKRLEGGELDVAVDQLEKGQKSMKQVCANAKCVHSARSKVVCSSPSVSSLEFQLKSCNEACKAVSDQGSVPISNSKFCIQESSSSHDKKVILTSSTLTEVPDVTVMENVDNSCKVVQNKLEDASLDGKDMNAPMPMESSGSAQSLDRDTERDDTDHAFFSHPADINTMEAYGRNNNVTSSVAKEIALKGNIQLEEPVLSDVNDDNICELPPFTCRAVGQGTATMKGSEVTPPSSQNEYGVKFMIDNKSEVVVCETNSSEIQSEHSAMECEVVTEDTGESSLKHIEVSDGAEAVMTGSAADSDAKGVEVLHAVHDAGVMADAEGKTAKHFESLDVMGALQGVVLIDSPEENASANNDTSAERVETDAVVEYELVERVVDNRETWRTNWDSRKEMVELRTTDVEEMSRIEERPLHLGGKLSCVASAVSHPEEVAHVSALSPKALAPSPEEQTCPNGGRVGEESETVPGAISDSAPVGNVIQQSSDTSLPSDPGCSVEEGYNCADVLLDYSPSDSERETTQRELVRVQGEKEVNSIEVNEKINCIDMNKEVDNIDVSKEVESPEVNKKDSQEVNEEITKEMDNMEVNREMHSQDVNKEMDSQEVNMEMDSQKVNEEMESQEMNKEMNNEEVNGEMNNQEVNKEMNSQEVNKEMNNEEVNREMNNEEVNEEMNNEEVNKEMNSQEVNRETNSQEVNKEMDSQEVNNEEVNKEMNNEEVNKEVNSEEVNEEMKNEEVNEEMNNEEVNKMDSQEVNKEMDSQEVNKEMNNEKVNNEMSNEEVNKEMNNEEVNEEMNNEEVNEEVNKEMNNEEVNKETDSQEVNEEMNNEEVNKMNNEEENKEMNNEEVNKEMNNQEVNKETDSQEVNKEMNSEEMNKEMDSQEVNKETDSQEVNKEMNSEEMNKEMDSQEVNKVMNNEEVNKMNNQEVNKETDSQEVNKEMNNEEENKEMNNEEVNEEMNNEEVNKGTKGTDCQEVNKEMDNIHVSKEVDSPGVKKMDSQEVNKEMTKEMDNMEVNKEMDGQEANMEMDSQEVKKEMDSQKVNEEMESQEVNKEMDSEKVNEEIDGQETNKEVDNLEVNKEMDNLEVNKDMDSQEVNKEMDSQEVNKEMDSQDVNKEMDNFEVNEEMDNLEVNKAMVEEDSERLNGMGDEEMLDTKPGLVGGSELSKTELKTDMDQADDGQMLDYVGEDVSNGEVDKDRELNKEAVEDADRHLNKEAESEEFIVEKEICDREMMTDTEGVSHTGLNKEAADKELNHGANVVSGEVICDVGNEVVSNVENEVVDDVETEVVGDVETEVVGDVDTEVVGDVETEVVGDVDTEVVGDVDTEVVGDVDTEVVGDVDTEVVGDVDTEVVGDVENDMDNDVENEVVGDVDTEVVSEVKNEVVGDVENEVVGDVENDVVGDVENEVVGDVSNEVVDDVESEVVGDVENDVVGDVENEVVGDVENEVVCDVENDMDDDVENEVVGDVENNVVGDVENEVVSEVKNEVVGDVENDVVGDVENEVVDDVESEVVGDVENDVVGDVENEVVGDVENNVVCDVENEVVGDVENDVVDDVENEVVGDVGVEVVGDVDNKVVSDVDNEVVGVIDSEVIGGVDGEIVSDADNEVVGEAEYEIMCDVELTGENESEVVGDVESKKEADDREVEYGETEEVGTGYPSKETSIRDLTRENQESYMGDADDADESMDQVGVVEDLNIETEETAESKNCMEGEKVMLVPQAYHLANNREDTRRDGDEVECTAVVHDILQCVPSDDLLDEGKVKELFHEESVVDTEAQGDAQTGAVDQCKVGAGLTERSAEHQMDEGGVSAPSYFLNSDLDTLASTLPINDGHSDHTRSFNAKEGLKHGSERDEVPECVMHSDLDLSSAYTEACLDSDVQLQGDQERISGFKSEPGLAWCEEKEAEQPVSESERKVLMKTESEKHTVKAKRDEDHLKVECEGNVKLVSRKMKPKSTECMISEINKSEEKLKVESEGSIKSEVSNLSAESEDLIKIDSDECKRTIMEDDMIKAENGGLNAENEEIEAHQEHGKSRGVENEVTAVDMETMNKPVDSKGCEISEYSEDKMSNQRETAGSEDTSLILHHELEVSISKCIERPHCEEKSKGIAELCPILESTCHPGAVTQNSELPVDACIELDELESSKTYIDSISDTQQTWAGVQQSERKDSQYMGDGTEEATESNHCTEAVQNCKTLDNEEIFLKECKVESGEEVRCADPVYSNEVDVGGDSATSSYSQHLEVFDKGIGGERDTVSEKGTLCGGNDKEGTGGSSYEKEETVKADGDEDDDGDDLSDFDLVIEKDTSSRNFFVYSPHQGDAYPVLSEAKDLSSSATTAVVENSSSLPCDASQPQYNRFFHRKALSGAKAVKANVRQKQFVWEVDDEIGNTSDQVTVRKCQSFLAKSKDTSPGLEILERKRKALREKTETVPFTWDLEDVPEKVVRTSESSDQSTITLQKHSKKLSRTVPSIGSVHTEHVKGKARGATRATEEANHKKRALTPTGHSTTTNAPTAKRKRTPSTDPLPVKRKKVKASTEAVLKRNVSLAAPELINKSSPTFPYEKTEAAAAVDIFSMSEDPLQNLLNNNLENLITVDEEISFRRDSFSIIAGSLLEGQEEPLPKLTRRSRRSPVPTQKSSFGDSKPSTPVLPSPDSIKSSPALELIHQGLRSRHSSVESNRSDRSASTKRSKDACFHVERKRRRKQEDPLTPKLKKAGLIKITNTSNSTSATPSASDSSAPLTRSSGAAIKAFNQKNLRNRGINPLGLSPSTSPSQCSTVSNQQKHKAEPPRCKQSTQLVQKASPSAALKSTGALSHVNRPHLAPKAFPKTTSTLSGQATNTMTAVVKRRKPILPKTVTSTKNKSNPLPKKQSTTPATQTTVYRVDPQPTVATAKGAKPQAKWGSAVHTPLPPGTTAVKPKQVRVKRWKISKETKPAKKTKAKQRRDLITFKRT